MEILGNFIELGRLSFNTKIRRQIASKENLKIVQFSKCDNNNNNNNNNNFIYPI